MMVLRFRVLPKTSVVPLLALLLLWPGSPHAHRGVHAQLVQVTRLLRAAPRSVPLLLRRARLYRHHGERRHAFADLRRALRIAPRNPTLYRERAELELASAQPRRALQTTDQIAKLPGGLGWHGWLLRGRALARLRRRAQALRAYDRAITAGARTPDSYLERGGLAEALGKNALAARGYREGSKALGSPVVLRLALIRVEVAQRHYAAARAEIDTMLPRLPVKAPWLLRRATIYALEGRTTDARRDRQAALAEASELLRNRPSCQNHALLARARAALGVERNRHR